MDDPVVGISAEARDEDVELASHLGVDACVTSRSQ